MRYVATALLILHAIVSAACTSEQRLVVKATAFNSTRAQTDGRPHETACGVPLNPGVRIIAVSPDLEQQGLICGTEVKISGLKGTWTVGDRTAARHKQLIDIYMGRDVEAAKNWGVQDVEITWRGSPSTSRVRVAEAERRTVASPVRSH